MHKDVGWMFIFNYENNTGRQKFVSVNVTIDSSGVLYAKYYAISRFFTTGQSFERLSVKTTKTDILTLFSSPIRY